MISENRRQEEGRGERVYKLTLIPHIVKADDELSRSVPANVRVLELGELIGEVEYFDFWTIF